MSKIEIIDRLNSAAPKKKSIELIGCMQSYCGKKGEPFFHYTPDEYYQIPTGASKIERVFSQKIDGVVSDIMIIHREDNYPLLFVGKWNDGVL